MTPAEHREKQELKVLNAELRRENAELRARDEYLERRAAKISTALAAKGIPV